MSKRLWVLPIMAALALALFGSAPPAQATQALANTDIAGIHQVTGTGGALAALAASPPMLGMFLAADYYYTLLVAGAVPTVPTVTGPSLVAGFDFHSTFMATFAQRTAITSVGHIQEAMAVPIGSGLMPELAAGPAVSFTQVCPTSTFQTIAGTNHNSGLSPTFSVITTREMQQVFPVSPTIQRVVTMAVSLTSPKASTGAGGSLAYA